MKNLLLTSKRALITGGSRGIGYAIVSNFITQGCTVYYVSRSISTQHEQLVSMAKEYGVSVTYIEADVSDEHQCRSVIEQANHDAPLDILVNNAGITRDNLLIGLSSEDWHTLINANLSSVFYLSKYATKKMLRNKRGCIINISSIVGIQGNAGQTNYAASKAGIIAFSKSLAKEIGKRNIRVNVVAPGYIETDMTHAMAPDAKEKFLENVPLGRTGTGDEVASVCIFLASDLASYITGETITVSGGL